jgi:hypothetical protein
MQDPKAKEERPVPAPVQAERSGDPEVREIRRMRHPWVVIDADGRRLEPNLIPDE